MKDVTFLTVTMMATYLAGAWTAFNAVNEIGQHSYALAVVFFVLSAVNFHLHSNIKKIKERIDANSNKKDR